MNKRAISRVTAVVIIIVIIIIATTVTVFLTQRAPTTTTPTTITTTTTTPATTTTPITTTTPTITTTPPPKIPNPDTIVVESIGEPDYLDPAVDYETAGGEVLQNTYETLVWYNGTSATQFVPWLAERWEVSNDGMSYTFYLRKGIKFQDGTPFNATAVKYSIERAIIIGDPDGPAWMLDVIRGAGALLEKIWNGNATQADVDAWRAQKPIEILDTYTVRINLDRPYAPFISIMAFTVASIVSPTYVEAHGGVQVGKHNDWMDRHAEAGTGPFKVKSWESGVVTLEANPNYWRGPKGDIKPKVKYVILKTVTDHNTRILDLINGVADMVYVPADYWNQFIDMNVWLSEKRVVPIRSDVRAVGPLETFDINFIGLNMAIRNESGKIDPFQPFKNKKVRMAFAFAFDYDTYIREVLKGAAIQPNGAVPKGMFGYDPTIPKYPYNLTKAKELLTEAAKELGLSPDKPKTLTIYYNAGNLAREKAALLLASAINSMNVGLILQVVPLAWPQFLAKLRARQLPIFFLGWAPDYIDPDDYLVPFGHGEKGTFPIRIGYNNPEVNKLIDEQSKEFDPVKRAAMIKQIVQMINDDYVYIWLSQPVGIHFERTWIHGWYYNPAFAGNYYATIYKA